jgi:hypothetical protein
MATADDKRTGPASVTDEAALVREARELFPPLGEVEPRPGFSRRVALRAAEVRPRPFGAPWWRWAFSGGALAATAALLLLLVPRGQPARPALGDGALAQLATGPELLLAQRLELYEDLTVVQDQDALEEMDVVAVLHELQPEGKP